MKYLEPSFSVDPPARVTACMRCVYDRGEHAPWCPLRAIAAGEIGSVGQSADPVQSVHAGPDQQ